MIFIIKIIVKVVIVGASTYTIEWLKNHWLSEWRDILTIVVVAIVAAVAIDLVDFTSDSLGKKLSRPTITVQTSRQDSEIGLLIKIKGSVDRISLNYPILGIITNFQDLSSLTDARTVVARAIGGTASSSVQNNLQITITDIRKDAVLQYKIFYEPSQQRIQIAGTDRYELIYVWEYNTEKIQNMEWRMTKDDSVTTKPSVQVMDTQVFDRALTQEEIEKLYQAGPPQRNI